MLDEPPPNDPGATFDALFRLMFLAATLFGVFLAAVPNNYSQGPLNSPGRVVQVCLWVMVLFTWFHGALQLLSRPSRVAAAVDAERRFMAGAYVGLSMVGEVMALELSKGLDAMVYAVGVALVTDATGRFTRVAEHRVAPGWAWTACAASELALAVLLLAAQTWRVYLV
jgi:hypothetical protein